MPGKSFEPRADDPDGAWRGPRPPSRLRRPRAAAPAPDPATAATLARMVGAVAAAGPGRRRQLASRLDACGDPAAVRLVVDALVGALRRARSPARRAAYADALVALGAAAAAAAAGPALAASRVGRHQAALAGVLGEVGPTLPPGERVGLLLGLDIALHRAADADAVAAVGRALAAVQASLDREPDPHHGTEARRAP